MALQVDGVTLVVMTIDDCNLTCRYCSTPNDSGIEVPPEAVEKAVVGLQDLFGQVVVGLSGGEPALHSRFEEIVDRIGARGAEFYLVTNGFGFENVLPILKRQGSLLTHVMFSLESGDRDANDQIRGEGSFDAVTDGLRMCHENGIRSSLGCALNRHNLGHIETLIRLAEERMVIDGVYCWPAFPTRALVKDGAVLTEADRAYLVEKAAQMGNSRWTLFGDLFRFEDYYQECAPLGLRQFTLNPDGNFSLCCNLTLYRGETGKEDELGPIRNHSVSELVERHVDHGAAYQKALLKDTVGKTPGGLRGYPCFHCQSYHRKLDWLPDAVSRREADGSNIPTDSELVQIQKTPE